MWSRMIAVKVMCNDKILDLEGKAVFAMDREWGMKKRKPSE